MDVGVLKMFYEMYPDSDPKCCSKFKFVKYTKGGKLVSIDVYYRSDRGTVRIIKGKEDVRWRKFLHSSPTTKDSLRDPTWEEIFSEVEVERHTPEEEPPHLLRSSPRDTSALNREDIMALVIIGGISAYILCNYIIKSGSRRCTV